MFILCYILIGCILIILLDSFSDNRKILSYKERWGLFFLNLCLACLWPGFLFSYIIRFMFDILYKE